MSRSSADDDKRECLKREYEEYLRTQRGLSERTIYHCWRFADRFLTFRFPASADDLSRITPLDIVKFLQSCHAGVLLPSG